MFYVFLFPFSFTYVFSSFAARCQSMGMLMPNRGRSDNPLRSCSVRSSGKNREQNRRNCIVFGSFLVLVCELVSQFLLVMLPKHTVVTCTCKLVHQV